MKELDTVVLLVDLPEHKLCRGDMGAIVLVYDEGEAYEVEFVDKGGHTVALVTLEPAQIRELRETDIFQVRHAS